MGMPLKETVATASEKKNITIGGQENLIVQYYTKKVVVKDS